MRPTFIFLICVTASIQVFADETDRNLKLKALQSLGYADNFRASLRGMCSAPFYSNYPVCIKLDKLKNIEIETVVLPFFSKYVSSSDSQFIIKFYESEPGKEIRNKLISAVEKNSAPNFTDFELKLLDDFNKSSAGKSLNKLASDKQASSEIIQKLNK